jgi:acyl carrier protein
VAHQVKDMQDYQDIIAQLFELLKPFAGNTKEFTEETDLLADLGLDSMQVMNLLLAVEDRFNISIPLNVLADVRTVKDFALQLQRLIEE